MAAASASEAAQQEGEWIKVTRKNIPPPPPPMFGHNKSELFKLFGTNVAYSTDSSSSKASSKSGDLSIMNPVVIQEHGNDGFETQMASDLAPPNMYEGLQNDANDSLFYPDPIAAELYVYENEDMLDYGDELEPMDAFGELSSDGMQDAIENVFIDVPPSSEYLIANLSNPAQLAASILNPLVAPSESAAVALEFESLGVETPTNSESSKRKLDVDDDDAVSSGRMGAHSKKGKHDI